MSIFNFFNDQQLETLTKEIDDVVRSIPVKDSNIDTSDTTSSSILQKFLAAEDSFASERSLKENPFAVKLDKTPSGISEASMLLDKLSISPERAQRYRVYEELYNSCPIVKKIVNVWVNNLFQKNPVTGKSLLIKDCIDSNQSETSMNENATKDKVKMAELFIDEVIDYFDLVKKLKHKIVPHQLIYGDSFVELIDLNDFNPLKDANGELFLHESSVYDKRSRLKPTRKLSDNEILENIQAQLETKSKINERELNNILENLTDVFFDDTTENVVNELKMRKMTGKGSVRLKEKSPNKKPTSDYESYYDYYTDKVSSDGKLIPFLKEFKHKTPLKETHHITEGSELKHYLDTDLDLSRIMMLVHHPKNIIILKTRYGSKLGYIEVTDKENIQVTNIAQQLSTLVGRYMSIGEKNTDSVEEITTKLIKLVIKKLIRNDNNKKGKKDSIEDILKSLDPEVINVIKKLIIETYKDDPKVVNCKKIHARFIPIDRMLQFTNKPADYDPYGSSIIEPLVLQGKLYMLSQLSNIVMKLSRAAPIRKWIIDIGPLQDQVRYVQQIKRELYNQKVTLSDIMSFKSAPKLLSDFKDMFTFRKNGQSSLDMELQQLGDPSVKVQDLEDARRELIALSGIPKKWCGDIKK